MHLRSRFNDVVYQVKKKQKCKKLFLPWLPDEAIWTEKLEKNVEI